MWDHGDIQSQWSPSQQLSNDVSYLGLPDTSLISTWLSIWGLRWYSFTWGCPIMVIFIKIDLQVKSFPLMYHMLVHLIFFINSTCSSLEVWDSKISHQDVGSWWHSESMISKSSAFQWCIICWFIWNFCNLYIIKGLRFEMVYLHIRMWDDGDIQNQWSPNQQLSNDVSFLGLSETF